MAKIKYLKQQKRMSQSQTNVNADGDESDSEDREVFEEPSSSCQEDLDFLKIAVINEENMDIIKSKIAATSEYRRQLIRANHSIDLLENFPYFFHNPKLVTQHFKNNNNNNSNQLINTFIKLIYLYI